MSKSLITRIKSNKSYEGHLFRLLVPILKLNVIISRANLLSFLAKTIPPHPTFFFFLAFLHDRLVNSPSDDLVNSYKSSSYLFSKGREKKMRSQHTSFNMVQKIDDCQSAIFFIFINLMIATISKLLNVFLNSCCFKHFPYPLRNPFQCHEI